MFENPGGKIKKLTTILFWINVVGFVILAFVFGFDRTYRSTYMNALFPVFIIIGPLVSYIECLLLYGFGELIESNELSKKKLDDIVTAVGNGKPVEDKHRLEEKQKQEEGKRQLEEQRKEERRRQEERRKQEELRQQEAELRLAEAQRKKAEDQRILAEKRQLEKEQRLLDTPPTDEELKLWHAAEAARIEKFHKIDEEVIFGQYPQRENGEAEEIEWIVLDINGTKSLLISKKALDAKKFNDTYKGKKWEECTLQQWLNTEFLDTAFTQDEQTSICLTTTSVTLDGAAASNAFLLSEQEAMKYFAFNKDRACQVTPYAERQGAFCNMVGKCWWWLRTADTTNGKAACVDLDGKIMYVDVDNTDCAVRPAIWVDTKLLDYDGADVEERVERKKETRKEANKQTEKESAAKKVDVDPSKKFICRSCKQRFTGWYSTCPGCGAANTMERVKR